MKPINESPQKYPENLPTPQIDNLGKEIIKKFQSIVTEKQLNLKQIFSNFDKNSSGTLDQNEFVSFLKVVDPSLSPENAKHVMQYLNKKNSSEVSFQEFYNIFYVTDYQPLKSNTFLLKQRGEKVLKDIKYYIESKNISIADLFMQITKKKDAPLDICDFGKLLLSIDSSLTMEEIDYVFKLLDTDGDLTVSIKEFALQVQENLCIPWQNVQGVKMKKEINPYVQQALNNFKGIIKVYRLDMNQAFKNFDTSADGFLNLGEFIRFVQIIDANLSQSIATEIFQVLDEMKKGYITFQEFSNLFQ